MQPLQGEYTAKPALCQRLRRRDSQRRPCSGSPPPAPYRQPG
nr:MAG TPA: hypothetical protein [Caudoviricetes sp.]